MIIKPSSCNNCCNLTHVLGILEFRGTLDLGTVSVQKIQIPSNKHLVIEDPCSNTMAEKSPDNSSVSVDLPDHLNPLVNAENLGLCQL